MTDRQQCQLSEMPRQHLAVDFSVIVPFRLVLVGNEKPKRGPLLQPKIFQVRRIDLLCWYCRVRGLFCIVDQSIITMLVHRVSVPAKPGEQHSVRPRSISSATRVIESQDAKRRARGAFQGKLILIGDCEQPNGRGRRGRSLSRHQSQYPVAITEHLGNCGVADAMFLEHAF